MKKIFARKLWNENSLYVIIRRKRKQIVQNIVSPIGILLEGRLMGMKKRSGTPLVHRIKTVWQDLNQSIYVGDRLKENLSAMTFVSLFTMLLGLVLIVFNLFIRRLPFLDFAVLMSFVTCAAGAGCAFCCRVLKNREAAILIPTLFCVVVFTVYAITGYLEGTGILWSLLLPIGMCYFISVKMGILLSAYYSLLYFILFLTPLGARTTAFYTSAFVIRFPMAFFSLSVFTAIAMIQYHRSVLLEIRYTDRLNAEVARQTAVAEERARKIEEMSLQTIQTLAYAIDAKDPYTKGHSTRVSQYSAIIAEKLGWSPDRISDLRYAALLHDIGKIGVPDSILNNPKKLTDVEYSIIKSHTTMGGDILRDRTMIRSAEDVARSHHERYDGRGYPAGLKGEEISAEARIVAIADAFDAMSSNRIYRKSCDPEYILRELEQGRGTQFDPEFTGVFLQLLKEGHLEEILQKDAPESAGSPESPSALLQEVVEAFAAQNAADAVDLITGVMSRSAGEGAIAKRMQQEAGCLAFVDMDNLKTINDTLGHESGDHALHLLGEILLSCVGEDGLCCRLGGDEFLLFLPGFTRDAAEKRIRIIISRFNEKKAENSATAVATLSAGLVMCSPSDTYLTAYNRADKALYHVKQNGKNGYSFFNEESELDTTDVNRLVPGIRTAGRYSGGLNVEYRHFTRLYDFIENLESRFSQPFKLVLITLSPAEESTVRIEEQENAMYYMEQAIRQTIRGVDVLTRYSSRQYLVILVGAKAEGVQGAVDRIFRGYYKMNGSGAFTPAFTVADPEEAKERGAL